MTFVIDDPETSRLLQELADLTGETMEEAAMAAIHHRGIRLAPDAIEDNRRRELLALADRLASRFREPYRSLDHGEWLYDENGLPR